MTHCQLLERESDLAV